jgi:hypothetical protein
MIWHAGALTLFAAVAACADPSTYPNCGPPPQHWLTPSDGIGELMITNRIHLQKSGRLKWNSETINAAELAHLLRVAASFDQVPQIIFQVDDGADCNRTRSIRLLIDRMQICQVPSFCGEGVGWQR